MRQGWARAALAVALRPSLWGTAGRQVVVLARPGWWHRRPFLPWPDAGYLRFRLETAYGGDGRSGDGRSGDGRSGDGRVPDARDLVTYLLWCREFRSLAGR